MTLAAAPVSLADALTNAQLFQIEQILEDDRAMRPRIWDACDDQAKRRVADLVRRGEAKSMAKLPELREQHARKFALEQVVNYALSQGMQMAQVEALCKTVLGDEGYRKLTLGVPPAREHIDDLRARIHLLSVFDPALC